MQGMTLKVGNNVWLSIENNGNNAGFMVGNNAGFMVGNNGNNAGLRVGAQH